MSEHATDQSNKNWKWATVILVILIALALVCATSLIWGGLIGFALGRSFGHRDMMGSYRLDEVPALPEIPDLPELTPRTDMRPWLGVGFMTTADGARVTTVVPGSPAETAGLEVGDIIVAVDGRNVTQAMPLDEIIQQYEAGDRVDLTVERGGRERTIRVRLASRILLEMPELRQGFPLEIPAEPRRDS
jgi:membrane-associated protease RseP (regulator of RpoE activity)